MKKSPGLRRRTNGGIEGDLAPSQDEPVRLEFIRDHLCELPEPIRCTNAFEGLKILDIGCIAAFREPLSRLGGSVTGIDVGENIRLLPITLHEWD